MASDKFSPDFGGIYSPSMDTTPKHTPGDTKAAGFRVPLSAPSRPGPGADLPRFLKANGGEHQGAARPWVQRVLASLFG